MSKQIKQVSINIQKPNTQEIESLKPGFYSIGKTALATNGTAWTYNEVGLTYNQAGYTYSGIEAFSDKPAQMDTILSM